MLLSGYKRYTRYMLEKRPQAIARLSGSSAYPTVAGTVCFFPVPEDVLVTAEVRGLPTSSTGFHGFHIHEGGSCTGNASDPFADTKAHYNPGDRLHPQHAGDLPPLLSAGGRAYLTVLTDRFAIPDILGKTVIVHHDPDDLHTQPAGNAGTKIACGVIRKR